MRPLERGLGRAQLFVYRVPSCCRLCQARLVLDSLIGKQRAGRRHVRRVPPLGVPNRPAPLLTKTLLFLGEGSNSVIGTPQVDWGWGKKFRAYDKATGKVVAEVDLPSGTTGAPMTYMHKGKQYILVPVGARDHPAEFVALGLMDSKPTTAGAERR